MFVVTDRNVVSPLHLWKFSCNVTSEYSWKLVNQMTIFLYNQKCYLDRTWNAWENVKETPLEHAWHGWVYKTNVTSTQTAQLLDLVFLSFLLRHVSAEMKLMKNPHKILPQVKLQITLTWLYLWSRFSFTSRWYSRRCRIVPVCDCLCVRVLSILICELANCILLYKYDIFKIFSGQYLD